MQGQWQKNTSVKLVVVVGLDSKEDILFVDCDFLTDFYLFLFIVFKAKSHSSLLFVKLERIVV